MPSVRFSHYNLRADRAMLARLRDFYVGVVGLREGPRPDFSVHGYWLYADEDPVLHLSEAGESTMAGQSRPAGFSHAAFLCADLEDSRRRLHDASVAFRQTKVPGSEAPQLFCSDPAGNGVELLFEPPVTSAVDSRPAGTTGVKG